MDTSFWNNPINTNYDQIKRIVFSQRIKSEKIILNTGEHSAEIIGTDGIYQVTLDGCTCCDYEKRNLPCKHMYRLAYELGEFELPDINRKEAKLFKMSIPEETEHYKDLFLKGAISGEKMIRIINALHSN